MIKEPANKFQSDCGLQRGPESRRRFDGMLVACREAVPVLPGLLLLSLLATSALAQEPDARPVPEIGEDTRHWLELQRSGRQATTASDRLSPGAAREAERRMVESFGHPVPEYFVDKAFSDE